MCTIKMYNINLKQTWGLWYTQHWDYLECVLPSRVPELGKLA